MRALSLVSFVLVAACGGSVSNVGVNESDGGSDLPQGDPSITQGDDACQTNAEMFGVNRVAIGTQMEDSTVTTAPFDVRYIYLAAGVPDGSGPCNS
ncbi:MAG: hypothetical protein H7Z43_07300, partial [Clostridia bacterium]|nr:hypothetical protein [Deltaproteobacteria bacterium]